MVLSFPLLLKKADIQVMNNLGISSQDPQFPFSLIVQIWFIIWTKKAKEEYLIAITIHCIKNNIPHS